MIYQPPIHIEHVQTTDTTRHGVVASRELGGSFSLRVNQPFSFDTADYQNADAAVWDGSTFTAPVSSFYTVSMNMLYNLTAPAGSRPYVYSSNGSVYFFDAVDVDTTETLRTMSFSYVTYLDAGQSLQFIYRDLSGNSTFEYHLAYGQKAMTQLAIFW